MKLELTDDPHAVIERHGDVPDARAATILSHMQGISPRVSLAHLLGQFRAGGMPPAELALAEDLAGLRPPEDEYDPAELGDFSGLPEVDADDRTDRSDRSDLTDHSYPG